MSLPRTLDAPPTRRWWDPASCLTGFGVGVALSLGWFVVASWVPVHSGPATRPIELGALVPLLLLTVPRHRHRALGLTVGVLVGAVVGTVATAAGIFVAIVLGGI